MRGIVTLLALTLAVAGCADSGAAPTGEQPIGTQEVFLASPEDGAFTEGGSIEGLVVDDSVTPIAGASVGIDGFEAVAVSGPAGEFVFKSVPAGTYQVFAAALGFSSQGKSVEVVPNEVTTITFELVSVALEGQVFSELFIFKGFMPCGFGLVAVTVTAACPFGTGGFQVATDTEVTPEIQTIVDELLWTQSSALSAQRLFMTVGKDETCNPCTYEYQYARTPSGPSPIVVRMDRGVAACGNCKEGFEGITDQEDRTELFEVRHRVWVPGSQPSGVPDVGLPILVLEQSFEIYTTHFYGEKAPDTFAGSRPDA